MRFRIIPSERAKVGIYRFLHDGPFTIVECVAKVNEGYCGTMPYTVGEACTLIARGIEKNEIEVVP